MHFLFLFLVVLVNQDKAHGNARNAIVFNKFFPPPNWLTSGCSFYDLMFWTPQINLFFYYCYLISISVHVDVCSHSNLTQHDYFHSKLPHVLFCAQVWHHPQWPVTAQIRGRFSPSRAIYPVIRESKWHPTLETECFPVDLIIQTSRTVQANCTNSLTARYKMGCIKTSHSSRELPLPHSMSGRAQAKIQSLAKDWDAGTLAWAGKMLQSNWM